MVSAQLACMLLTLSVTSRAEMQSATKTRQGWAAVLSAYSGCIQLYTTPAKVLMGAGLKRAGVLTIAILTVAPRGV